MSVANPGQARADDIGIMPDDPLAAMMANDGTQPEKEVVPAKLPTAPGVYRFRTRPGLRSTTINLRMARESFEHDTELAARNRASFEKWARREFGNDFKKVLAPDQNVYKLLGSERIEFKPVRSGVADREAVFETTDPEIARYIRSRLPEFPQIYEDIQPFEIEVNGEKIMVLPADDDSRNRAGAALAGD